MNKVRAVPQVSYRGESGILVIRQLQRDLVSALKEEDWGRVKHLDRVCALVVDRVVKMNQDDQSILVRALAELKSVYAGLLQECRDKADKICVSM